MSKILIDYIQMEIIGHPSEAALSVDDDLLSSGLIDSLGIMKLISFLEDRFDLTIPPEDMTIENFMTVAAIETYLQRRKPDLNGTIS